MDRVIVLLPRSLAGALDDQAAELGLSRSALIRTILLRTVRSEAGDRSTARES